MDEGAMDDDSDREDETTAEPESLLPYDFWAEAALREVVVRALDHAERYGLPGAHHFFITFRTDQPGVEMPARLRAQYPREITIVLQHQFWDLAVDHARQRFGVGLSFGGIASKITVPFAAITAFADPAVQFGLQFRVSDPPAEDVSVQDVAAGTDTERASAPDGEEGTAAVKPSATPQVVELAAFRKRMPTNPPTDAKE